MGEHANRILRLCVAKLQEGVSKDEVATLRDEQYRIVMGTSSIEGKGTVDTTRDVQPKPDGFEDVPKDHALYGKVWTERSDGSIQANYKTATGVSTSFSTKASAVGGSYDHANRILRLCIAKLREGASKSEV